MNSFFSKRHLIGSAILLLLVAGGLWRMQQSGAKQWHEISRFGLHSYLNIKWESDGETAKSIRRGVDSLLTVMESHFSETSPGHPFQKLWRAPLNTEVSLNETQRELLDFFHKTVPETNGPLQLGAGEWLHRLGLVEDEAETSPPGPSFDADSLREILRRPYYAYQDGAIKLLKGPVRLTLGSVSKGYGIEALAGLFESHSVSHFMINAGGDLHYRGNSPRGTPWNIGIQHPRGETQSSLLGIVSAPSHRRGLATSGDYELYRMEGDRRIHHLVDARWGKPVGDKQSLTVIAPDALLADFYATYLFLLPMEKVLALANGDPNLDVLLVDSAGTIHQSRGMEKYFSTP